MQSNTSIDTMAFAGYQYATNTGEPREVTIETEMDLMAFNAGISNANIVHNLAVPTITRYGAVRIGKHSFRLQFNLREHGSTDSGHLR